MPNARLNDCRCRRRLITADADDLRAATMAQAVEQIRLAEEVKITKEKIKEVEEEWQSNLLNWKSKRRSGNSLTTSGSNLAANNNNNNSGSSDLLDQEDDGSSRKVKTFTEILNEKAKSGHRLGYNLRRYVATDDEDDEELDEIRLIQARNPHRSTCL